MLLIIFTIIINQVGMGNKRPIKPIESNIFKMLLYTFTDYETINFKKKTIGIEKYNTKRSQ